MKSIKTNFCFIYSFLLRHRLLVEAGRLSLLLRYTDLTKVILDALANIRLKVILIKIIFKLFYFYIKGTRISLRSTIITS
jgi:hypothetical protein